MTEDVVILTAEDDEGHFALVKKNLKRAGISNKIIRFKDGRETLDFLFGDTSGSQNGGPDKAYILLLDIRMPRVDGIEVLRRIKQSKNWKLMPVTMLTTTDDPDDIDLCHKLGCSGYVVKPIQYEQFASAVKNMGAFLSMVEVPQA
jgi:CheY-like chemotaxis protein